MTLPSVAYRRLQELLARKFASRLFQTISGRPKDHEGKPERGAPTIQSVGFWLVAFFTSDQAIIDCADDSWGEVGRVFSRDGVELFRRFAAKCPDKSLILGHLIDLLEDDSYCVRGDLIKEVLRFLPLADIQLLMTQCRLKAEQAENNYRRSEWLNFASSLEEQVDGNPHEKHSDTKPSLTSGDVTR